jgi:hypothetical protein
MKKSVMITSVVALLLALVPLSYAQTTAPTPSPSGYPFTVTGNFSASTSNTIKNGMQSTFEYAVHGRWSLRVDDIGLTAPSGTLINLGEGQWKIPANAIFGKSSPASFSNILIGIHAGLGAVKNAAGGVAFGAGVGMSADYKVSSFFFIRVVDITDVYSRGLVPPNQLFGNYNNVNIGAGIGFNF